LQLIELPSFVAISEYGIEDNASRYQMIKTKKESGNWFRPAAKEVDIEISYIPNGQTCQVIGTGKIIANSKTIRHSHYSELWFNTDNGWKAQSLHVSQAE